ncbi:MAG: hypothetical protein GW917_03710, partial [Bdellovibrionales bacterium]|nr:hypothetical protein [Bdellovibrionales bacterium]
MKLDRREFLKWSSLGLSAAGISSHAFADKAYRVERRDSPSILQGATDQTMTQFSVVHHSKNLNFLIKDSTGRTKLPDAVYEMQRPGLEKMIYKVLCSGLQLGEDYELLVIEESTQDVIDTRTFSTLDTTSVQLRFAICSCMDEFKHSPHIWKDLVLQAPDFILFVGDSTYVDYGPGPEMGPDRLWQRFAEARSVLDIYFSQKLIPLLAIWDDHDFGKNDSGKEFPFLKESQENFLSFFALDEGYASCMARGPGVSSSLRLGRQQFLLMDDRSFRVAGFSKERYAHWGQEQEEWMIERLTEHIGPSWIINGSQIFPQMTFKQSYSGEHPVQFAALKEHL